MKDLEIKKRTKECLDIQINEKLKRKMEEESQEKEFEEKRQNIVNDNKIINNENED